MLIKILNPSNGIGDSLAMLPAIQAMRNLYKSDTIMFGTKHEKWVRYWPCYDSICEGNNCVPADMICNPYSSYDVELEEKSGKSRHLYYARELSGLLEIPKCTIEPNLDYKDHILLCPYSAHATRMWEWSRWIELSKRLPGKVAVLGEKRAYLSDFPCEQLGDLKPQEVISLIGGCKYVIGVDSCLLHVAGLLQRPGLALMGPTDGKTVWSWYKCLQWLQGGISCSPCYFSGANFVDGCRMRCASIRAITVEQVLAAVGSLKN